ncbi:MULTISPECIES: ECF transporter S component [Clostridium]|uniref:ECF transporter S component n=1 Tax=Clostridium nitritogenes TaxID=83340 RepID=A0ABN1LNH3_9CLOT|nr:ECF transporter S component [Clostridium baratii]AQM60140.1 BioY family transporter [Clostridium baratii]MBT9831668.1 ECF transporter S component [Clostridium baratii]MDU1855157.1 ECF transporter S component [Clostridium baratii]STA99926.1 membrane spanning protein [Clostridium baratii]
MKNEKTLNDDKVKMLSLTGLMIALIFISGSIIKIPTLNGFMQIGDCMVFLSAILLGKKYSFVASGIGMALVDGLGGYLAWAPFTFIIKGLMAYVAALVIYKAKEKNFKVYLIGFIVGGIVDLLGYFIANAIMGGLIVKSSKGLVGSVIYAAAHIPGDLMQVVVGIIIAVVLAPLVYKLRENI